MLPGKRSLALGGAGALGGAAALGGVGAGGGGASLVHGEVDSGAPEPGSDGEGVVVVGELLDGVVGAVEGEPGDFDVGNVAQSAVGSLLGAHDDVVSKAEGDHQHDVTLSGVVPEAADAAEADGGADLEGADITAELTGGPAGNHVGEDVEFAMGK